MLGRKAEGGLGGGGRLHTDVTSSFSESFDCTVRDVTACRQLFPPTPWCTPLLPPRPPAKKKCCRIHLFFSARCVCVLTTGLSVYTCVHLLCVCVWEEMEKDTKRLEGEGGEVGWKGVVGVWGVDPPPLLHFLGSLRTGGSQSQIRFLISSVSCSL